MPLTTPQESVSLIAAAIRAGITANPTQAGVLRIVRREWKEQVDVSQDLQAAVDYLRTTPVGQMEEVATKQSLALVGQAVNGFTDTQCTQLRDRLRQAMVAAAAPQWLKDCAEEAKRSLRCNVVSPGVRTADQIATDPCVVAAEAALLVLPAANSTREQLTAAADSIERWKRLTPLVQNPVSQLP